MLILLDMSCARAGLSIQGLVGCAPIALPPAIPAPPEFETRVCAARSLPEGVRRRAVVPASFDLDRGRRATYPAPEPAATTYLELSIRKRSASNSVAVCQGGTPGYTVAATCICGGGRVEAFGALEGVRL